MEEMVTIQDLIKELSSLNPPVYLKDGAIRQYAKDGLILGPKIEGGRGKGKTAFFRMCSIPEIAASYELINQYPGQKEEIAEARKAAIKIITLSDLVSPAEFGKQDSLYEIFKNKPFVALLASEWLKNYLEFTEQLTKLDLTIEDMKTKMQAINNKDGEEYKILEGRKEIREKEKHMNYALKRIFPVLAHLATWGKTTKTFEELNFNNYG